MGKKIDMTGWVMKEHGILDSRLTILEQDKEYKKRNNIKSNFAYWKCKCECGTIFSAEGNSLRQGKIKSCGCLNKEKLKERSLQNKNNLIGKTFGFLYVESEDLDRKRKKGNGHAYWNCKCLNCGKKVSVIGTHLSMGLSFSCGCISSKGELFITKLLLENNIKFESQKTFETCRSQITNYPLKFDFYINDSFLVEFDGQQHFSCSESWWNTKEKFQQIKEYDNYKNNWSKENNIPLKRIPYWKLNNLTLEDIMGDKYLII